MQVIHDFLVRMEDTGTGFRLSNKGVVTMLTNLADPVPVEAGQIGEQRQRPRVGEPKAFARVLHSDEKIVPDLHMPLLVQPVFRLLTAPGASAPPPCPRMPHRYPARPPPV